MEKAFVDLLLGSGALVSLIADRIYPVIRPQGSPTPCVVYNGFAPEQVMTTSAPANLAGKRVQVTAYAKTYPDAKVIEAALNARLIGFSGVVSGVEFQGIFENGGAGDGFEHAAPDRLFKVSTDYLVWAAVAS